MVGFRNAIVCGVVSATICSIAICSTSRAAAPADAQHGKTAKQCSEELKANAAAIEAAGESASAFFHACWWRTSAGQKTPIESAVKPAPAAGPKVVEAAGSHRSIPGAAVRPAHREPRPRTAGRQTTHRDSLSTRETELSAPVETPPAVAEPQDSNVPPRPTSAREPLIEAVPVTVAGVPDAVVLPVAPGLMPLVRSVLNHPAVPGLTSTP